MISDVLVIGGGPAGTSSAILFAHQGFSVTLLDRCSFPRDKTCGEYVNPAAWKMLTQELQISPYQLLNCGAYPHSQIVLDCGEGGTLKSTLLNRDGSQTLGYSIPRWKLDLLLIEEAKRTGINIIEGWNVRSLLIRDDCVMGVCADSKAGEKRDFYSKLIIAADGTHSIAARQLKLVKPLPYMQSIGITAHFRNLQSLDDGVTLLPSHKTSARGVAGFSSQAQGGAVFNCVLPVKSCGLAAGRLHEFIFEQAEHFGISKRLSGSEIFSIRSTSCFGHRLKQTFYDGILFVGDAACFVDPFTGEGIHHAIEGAIYAARVGVKALHKSDVTIRQLVEYAKLRKSLNSRYIFSAAVKTVVNNPLIMNYIFDNLKRSPSAMEKLIGVCSDLLPVNAAFSPQLMWSLVSAN